MKKFLKAALAFAMVAAVTTGCGAKANYTKVGLGVVSSYSEGQVNSTFVALGLDGDGKIQYIDLDVAQSTPGGDGEYDQTKEERGSDYGMAAISPIGKEWNEQAEAFEAWCKGKTPDEVAAVETMDYHGGKAANTGTDLAAGCTIVIDDFLAAVAKAATNAVEVEADSIVLGRTMSNDADAKQTSTDLVLLAKDADGKVVYAKWDVAQISKGVTDTKSELKEGYGMAAISPIGKEWYEQAAAFEEFCKGKTVEEIAAVETMDYHGGKAANTGTDLAAGCTITLDGPLAAIAKAK
ncbi:MAG: hypothetical protein U0L85_02710 [Bacilli bacterium]|nr:hypothetical protein [Bacilli bacterium]